MGWKERDMASKARGKVPAKPLSESAGGGGEFEAADYIVSAVDDLILIARRHGLDTLVYLLDMVKMEADEERSLWRVRHQPPGDDSSGE